MKEKYIESKKLYKVIAIVVVAIFLIVSIVKYAIYLCTMHPYSTRSGLYFGPADEDGVTIPTFDEEDINPETGMVEQLAEGSSTTYYEKAIITVKGELQTGSFHYILYGDNERKVFEITLEEGVYYDETFEVYDIGCTQNNYFEYEPETKALDDGILIDKTYYAKGYTRDFGD